MALDYTDVFGDISSIYSGIVELEADVADVVTRRDAIVTAMTASGVTNQLPNVLSTYDNVLNGIQQNIESLIGLIQLRLTDIETVIRELSLVDGSSFESMIQALVFDMQANTKTIKKSALTLGSITTTTTNSSVGTVIRTKKLSSVDRPDNGYNVIREMAGVDSEYGVTDTLSVVCIEDNQGDTEFGNETFEVNGTLPQRLGTFHYQGGSVSGGIRLTPGHNTSLVDNFFEDFTSNVPDDWTVVSGTAGTHFGAETTIVMRGSNALHVSGSCELSFDIYDLITPGQTLALYMYMKKTTGAAGTVTVKATVNGSDIVSTATNATALSDSSWTLVSYEFPVPLNIGSAATISLTGAVTTGKIVVDGGALTPYTWINGIGIVVTQGLNRFLKNDNFVFDVTNDEAGKFQRLFVNAFGYQLPSASSPNITDPT